ATPATGRRILLSDHTVWAGQRVALDPDFITAALVSGVKEIADLAECSSIHWLFCTEEEAVRLASMGFARRWTYQFHWHNRDYTSYDDFLATLTSRKRKQLRKERRRALEPLDGPIEFIPGSELDDRQLAAMDRYYRTTVFAHGGMDYLQPGFFRHLVATDPEPVLFAQAQRGGQLIAGAFFMETDQGLYGRYWGCDEEIEFLHFETAYYSGIARCIERGIPLFEAGAQGEHKLLRGFVPSYTHSCHWMRHPGLHQAVCGEYLEHERRDITRRMAMLAEHGPYKCTSD
ncbi:MAG: GNAT family N-acetyltransferase, partial [Myxococcota bacterium]